MDRRASPLYYSVQSESVAEFTVVSTKARVSAAGPDAGPVRNRRRA